MTAKKHTILFVDDEISILNAVKRVLRKEPYTILTTSSGNTALAMLNTHAISLVVSDQRMVEMTGTELLHKISKDHPDVIRIILTGYTEVSSITDAINKGQIYKFLLKPWNDEHLKQEIRQALDQYDLVRDNKQLSQRILSQNEALKQMNDSLESKVKRRTRELELRNHALEVSHMVLANLPFAIVGVDRAGTIALVNHKVCELSLSGKSGIVIGDNISGYFPQTIIDRIHEVIEKNIEHRIPAGTIADIPYQIRINPLKGARSFQGKGAVLLFHE